MAPTARLQKVCQETTFKFCSPFNFAQRWKFLSKAQFEFTHRHEVQQEPDSARRWICATKEDTRAESNPEVLESLLRYLQVSKSQST